jgi:hypothetical protein
MATRISQGQRLALLTDIVTDLNDGVIHIYTGSPPATANLIESGTLLAIITQDSGAFVGGAPGNGLSLDIGTVAHADGYSTVAKTVAETWSGVGLVAGVAGWARYYANAYTTGASTTAVRWDGLCGLSNAQFIMSNLNIAVGETVTISSFTIKLPAY